MKNHDRRYERYQNDATFHQAVRVMGQLIDEHGFTHQDLLDAVFVSYMRFLELNPIPLTVMSAPEAKEKRG